MCFPFYKMHWKNFILLLISIFPIYIQFFFLSCVANFIVSYLIFNRFLFDIEIFLKKITTFLSCINILAKEAMKVMVESISSAHTKITFFILLSHFVIKMLYPELLCPTWPH